MDVPDVIKNHPREYRYMLNRDAADAGFRDYDPVAEKLIEA